MTPKMKWDHQISRLCSQASQKLGMLRRNCYFVRDVRRGRTLYLTLVRSIFNHCVVVWRPTNVTLANKIESIQKKGIKWILNEEEVSYADKTLYFRKCKELKILPMNMRFDFCDLIMLHKIIRGYMPISLPNYISFFTGKSRLRFCHLDKLSLVSSIIPRTCAGQGTTTNALANSFFYRSHLLWNMLPIEIRSIETISKFKVALEIHLFQKMYDSVNDNKIDSESE